MIFLCFRTGVAYDILIIIIGMITIVTLITIYFKSTYVLSAIQLLSHFILFNPGSKHVREA